MTPLDVSALDHLGVLSRYPRTDLTPRVRECATALHASAHTAAEELERFAYATAETPLDVLQEVYVGAFDFDPDCALEVGWHLFGESPDRGRFMADIRERLDRAGVPENEGLPDHLTNILPLLAREGPSQAAALAEQIAPALVHIRAALKERRNFYVHLLAAIQMAVASLCATHPEATT